MKKRKGTKPEFGDIILVKGKWWNPLSRFIEFLTSGKYSHSAVYSHGGLIIEASWTGVIVSNINKYRGRIDILKPKYKYFQRESTMWFLVSKIGAKYDYLGLFGVLFSMVGRCKSNNLDDKNRFWCSELIADALIFAEYPVCFHKDTYKVSPNDLFKCLK